jgi:hypothetical protein
MKVSNSKKLRLAPTPANKTLPGASNEPAGAKQAAEKGKYGTKFPRNIPQGLKPALIFAAYGTTKVVP